MNAHIAHPKTKRVMIVDDDEAIVEALKIMLELSGYEVSSTIDGAAINDTKKLLPDLLILDIWMPGMDGKTVCKILKADGNTKHIPILMISASNEIQIGAMECGADDFLPKPFEMDDLLGKVEMLMLKES